MPKKFDQDAKGRVVALVEDRILAEGDLHAGSVQDRGPETGCLRGILPGSGLEAARREGRAIDPLPEDLVAEVAKLRRGIRSFATLTSC